MPNYERGFITKCAEYGVDPETLVKVAGIGGFLGKMVGKSKALPKYIGDDAVRAATKQTGIGGFLGKASGKSKALPKYVNYDAVRRAAKRSTSNREFYESFNISKDDIIKALLNTDMSKLKI